MGSQLGLPDFISTAFFGGDFRTSEPFYSYIDTLHKPNDGSFSFGGYPSGGTQYDDALRLAISILQNSYPDQTTFIFFSPGSWNLKDFNLIELFRRRRD